MVGGYAAGELGPTVVVGHYDSKVAPGVFENLKQVGVGARIIVEQSDGTVFLYDVTKVEKVAKAEFPTDAVYGKTPTSTLRLITCGGAFDNNTRHYVDNTIVYADLVVTSVNEVRADRPITKYSEIPPIALTPREVDGGAGELVGPSLPPSETTTTAAATTTTTTTIASSTSISLTTLPPIASTTIITPTGDPTIPGPTAPAVAASAAPTTLVVPPLTEPAAPPTVAPISTLPLGATTAPPVSSSEVPATVPTSAPIEAGAPPATSVLP